MDITQDKITVVDYTKSLCPQCLKVIDAKVVEKKGTLFLNKKCEEHGTFEARHVFDTYKIYSSMKNIFCSLGESCRVYPRDLILYITSKCDQNCQICYMRANEKKLEKDPSLDEIVNAIADYAGEYVLLSGGEPTMREDLFKIIRAIKKRRFKVCLMTNGKRLQDIKYVKQLKNAGLDLIDLQFDSLNDANQEIMRGEKLVDIKKKAVENTSEIGIWIFLFSVIIDGVNTNQIGKLYEYCLENMDVIKILNFTPIWQLGRYSAFDRIANSRILEEIEKQTPLRIDDFITGTEFALLFFEIQRKLINKQWTRQPACALRTYILKFRKKPPLPLNKIINLEKLNFHLRNLNRALSSRKRIENWVLLLFKFPYRYFIKELLLDVNLCRLFREFIIDFFISLRKKHSVKEMFKSFKMLSIMVGVFHNKYNIDLNMVKKCTLYADLLNGEGMASACLVHIYDDENEKEAYVR